MSEPLNHDRQQRVAAAFARLDGHTLFSGADRLRRLLGYLVEQTLAGRAEQLRQTPIAIDVYQRGTDFDPSTDSIVRVDMSRLRTKLREYYAIVADPDGVVFTVPKGSYVLDIALPDNGGREPAPQITDEPAGERPNVAVLSFDVRSDREEDATIGEVLAAELIALLGHDPTIDVVSQRYTEAARRTEPDIRKLGQQIDAAYIIDGSVRRTKRGLRTLAALVDASDGRELWSQTFELGDDNNDDPGSIIAKSIGGIVAGTDGAIMVTHAADFLHRPLETLGVSELCDRASMQWAVNYCKASFIDAELACRRALELDIDYAPAHLWLGSALTHLVMNGWATDYTSARDAALQHVDRTLELDPRAANARLVGGDCLSWLGEADRGASLAMQGLEYSHSAAALFLAGQTLTHVGRHDEAISYFDEVSSMDYPMMASYAPHHRCAALFEIGRLDEAVTGAKAFGGAYLGQAHTIPPIICALAELDRVNEAVALREELNRVSPEYTLAFAEWFFPIAYPNDEVAGRYINGLRCAGLN